MFFCWHIIRVHGDSMEPTLREGDYVLIKRIKFPYLKGRGPQEGEVVYIDHPRLGKIIKCLGRKLAGGGFYLYGLSVKSMTREDLGIIQPEHILGRAVWCFSPNSSVRIKRN